MKKYGRPGSSPGLTHVEPPAPEAMPVRLSVIDYGDKVFTEESDVDLEICRRYFESPNVTWLHVQGHPELELLQAVGEAYELHTLALEDIVHFGQRPKVEVYERQLFAILGLPRYGPHGVHFEQVSLFLGPTYVVSFHNGEEDIFEPIRKRLRATPVGRIRQHGPDYLFYALIDLVVDHGFPLLEGLSRELEELEEQTFRDPSSQALERVHRIRRDLTDLRRMMWPQREALNALLREDSSMVKKKTHAYLRDCYDHSAQLIDLIDSFREITASVHEVYLSGLSNRLNDVMKVLTMIATVFIPLSFIVGLYGMNFDTSVSPWNMPELKWYWGYPLLLVLLAVVAIGMLMFFKRKKWL